METRVKRAYRVELREEQTRLTRRRILNAALRLFVGGGYSTVTMQDLARDAGVAYQTLYSHFRNKNQLALELCTSHFPHVGDTVAMLTKARDADDPEAWLRSLGLFARRLYEPCAEVLRFMRQSGDSTLLARYDEIQRGRLERLADLGPQLERRGRLHHGLSGQAAVDLVWVMTAPESYEQLVLDRGWAPEQFENWLGPALADLILAS